MAAMYMEPGGPAAAKSGRVSMEDVAEEVLNGFFCHYEPPTSVEYRRRAAEELRKNPSLFTASGHRRFKNSKSILRPARLFRDGGRNSKSVTWRDEQKAVHIEVLESTAPGCLNINSCDFLNSSTMPDPRAPTKPDSIPPPPTTGVSGNFQNQQRMDQNGPVNDRRSPRPVSPKIAKGPILYDDEGYPFVDEDSDDGIVDENIPPSIVPPPPSEREIYPSPRGMPPSPTMMNPFSCGIGIGEGCWPGPSAPPVAPNSDVYMQNDLIEGRTPSSQSLPYRRIRSPPVRNRYYNGMDEEDEDELLDDGDSYEARAPNRVGRAPSRTPMSPYSHNAGRRPPSPGHPEGEYLDEEEQAYDELNRLPVPRRSTPGRKSWYKRWRRPQTPNRRSEYDTDEEDEMAGIRPSASKAGKEEDGYDSDGFVDRLGRAIRPRRRSLSRERGGDDARRGRSPSRDIADEVQDEGRGRSRSPTRRLEDSDYVLENEEENMRRRRASRSPVRRRSASADRYGGDEYNSREDRDPEYYDDFQERPRKYSRDQEDLPDRMPRRMSRDYDERPSASFDYNSRRSPRDRGYEYDERGRSPRDSDYARRSPRRPASRMPRDEDGVNNDFDRGADSANVSALSKVPSREKEGRGRGRGSTRAQPMMLDQGQEGTKYNEEDDYFPEDGRTRHMPARERGSRPDRSRRVSDPTPASHRPRRSYDDEPDYEDYDRRRPHSTASHSSRRRDLALDTSYDEEVLGPRPDPTPRRRGDRREAVPPYEKQSRSQPLPPTPRRDEEESRESSSYRRKEVVEEDSSSARRARRMLEKQLSPISQATDLEIREEVSSVGMESSTIRPQYPNPFLAQNPPNPFMKVPNTLDENQTHDHSDPSTLSSPPPIEEPSKVGSITKTDSRSSSKKNGKGVPAASAGSVGSSKKSFLGVLRKKMGKVKGIVKDIDEKRLPAPAAFKPRPPPALSKE